MTPSWKDRDDEGHDPQPWEREDAALSNIVDDDVDEDAVYEDDLDEDDEWTEEDERRYQARRELDHRRVVRRRRQAAAFVLVVLVVLGVGITAAGVYQGRWDWPLIGGDDATGTQAQPCPTPTPTAAVPAEVTATVLNSTDRAGLAGAVAAELQARGFVVREIANDPSGVVAEPAQVRHGAEGLMAARTVAAHIRGAVLVDDGREGQVVEVSLGTGYVDMLPPDEAAALLVPPPVPSPAGCVPPSPVAPSTPPTTPATTPATTDAPTPAPTT